MPPEVNKVFTSAKHHNVEKKKKEIILLWSSDMTYKPIPHNNSNPFENEVVSAWEHRSSKGITIVWSIHSLDICNIAWNMDIYTDGTDNLEYFCS